MLLRAGNEDWGESMVGTSSRMRIDTGDFVYPRFNRPSDGVGSESQKGNVFGEHGYDLLVKSCRHSIP